MKPWRVVAVLVGLGLLAWAVSRVGLRPLLSAVSELGPAAFAAIVACQLALAAPTGLAWSLVAPAGARAGPASYVRARLIREAGTQILPLAPVGGAALGGRALVVDGASAPTATSSTVADMTVELTSQLVYLGFGVAALELSRPGAHLGHNTVIMALALAAMAAALLVARTRPALALIARLLHRLMGGRAHPLMAFIVQTRSGGGARPLRTAAACALHLIAWILGGAQTWLLLRFLHQKVPFAAGLCIDSLTSGAMAVAFVVPGGLGVQEAALIFFGGLFGVPPPVALAMSLTRRCRDLILALPVLAIWRFGGSRERKEQGAS